MSVTDQTAALLLSRAPCGLLTVQANGLIVHANDTFCRWIGYAADEVIGKQYFHDLLTTGGRIFQQTHWTPLMHLQRSVAEVKLDLRHEQGHLIPTLINAARREFEGETLDDLAVMVVTERHRYESELLLARQNAEHALDDRREAERALQESRDVLGLAMRGAHMGVWSRDLITQKLTWSHELEALIGPRDPDVPLTSDTLFEQVHVDDRRALSDAIQQARTDGTDYLVEFRMQHPHGGWRWMEGRGRAHYNRQGRALALHGLIIDISERKRGEALLKDLNRQLSDADHRKDAFLATLAHELRNPLAPMSNIIELLRQKDLSDPQLIWARDVFERQVHHMTHLVDDLLEVSRITQGKLELRKEVVVLSDVLSGAIEASRFLLQNATHELTVSIPGEPLLLDADPIRLSQMIQNLLNNAAKYTPPSGKISLTALRDDAKQQVVIRVQDSGIGIATEHLTSVFDMFSQLAPALDKSQGGLGIGLSLVKALAELHGGSIDAASVGVGHGSTFTLRLPLMTTPTPIDDTGEQPSNDADADTDSAIDTALHTLKILIVDDNEDAAVSLAMVLEMAEHEVQTAYDGETGFAKAETFNADVIILDIGLPDTNGYALAGRIRQTSWGKHTLLLALTGWGQQKDKQAALDAGFNRHFTKPVDFDGLLEAIAERQA